MSTRIMLGLVIMEEQMPLNWLRVWTSNSAAVQLRTALELANL